MPEMVCRHCCRRIETGRGPGSARLIVRVHVVKRLSTDWLGLPSLSVNLSLQPGKMGTVEHGNLPQYRSSDRKNSLMQCTGEFRFRFLLSRMA